MSSWFTQAGQQKIAETESQPKGGRSAHARILKEGSGCQIVEPTQQGCGLTFVPLPAVDLDKTVPGGPVHLVTDKHGVPCDRVTAAPNDFTRWFYAVPGVRMVGSRDRKVTMMFEGDPHAGDAKFSHPYVMLYEACWAAHHKEKKREVIQTPFGTSETEGWAALIRDDKGTGQDAKVEYKLLSRATNLYVMYGLVYAQGGRDRDEVYVSSGPPLGAADNDPLPVVLLTEATAKELLSKLNEPKDKDAVPDPSDLSTLRFPRATSTLFVHVFDKKKAFCPAMAAAEKEKWAQAGVQSPNPFGAGGAPSWGGRRQAASQPGTDANKPTLGGYDVYLSRTFEGTTAGNPAPTQWIDRQLAPAKLKHPSQVFKTHSNDEVAEILGTLGLPPGLLWYAFQSKRAWIPEEVKSMAVNRVAVQPGGQLPAPEPTGPAAPTWGGPPVPAAPPSAGGQFPAAPPAPTGAWAPPPAQAPARSAAGWPPPQRPAVASPADDGSLPAPPPAADVAAAYPAGVTDPAMAAVAEQALRGVLAANPNVAAAASRARSAAPIPPAPGD